MAVHTRDARAARHLEPGLHLTQIPQHIQRLPDIPANQHTISRLRDERLVKRFPLRVGEKIQMDIVCLLILIPQPWKMAV